MILIEFSKPGKYLFFFFFRYRMNMRVHFRSEPAEEGCMYPSYRFESYDFCKVPAPDIFLFDIGIYKLSVRRIPEPLIEPDRIIEEFLYGLFQDVVPSGLFMLPSVFPFQLLGFDLQRGTNGEIPDIPGRKGTLFIKAVPSAEGDTTQESAGLFQDQEIGLTQELHLGIKRSMPVPEFTGCTQNGIGQEFPNILAWLFFHTDRKLQVLQNFCLRCHAVIVEFAISNYHFLGILQKEYARLVPAGGMAGFPKKMVNFLVHFNLIADMKISFQSFFRIKTLITAVLLGLITDLTLMAQQDPAAFYGFKPGSDRNLFTYEELIRYLKHLDENSGKLKLVEIGNSPEGRPIYIAFISAAGNIDRLDELQKINKRLAMDTEIPVREKEALIADGKVFVLGTLSMHSTEVGPSQAAPLIAYDLITATDADRTKWLEDVVYMMVPCHNPDGMDMVVSHYLKYKGTKYEGSSMPRVYHKYVGHDNNRDFVTLSQEDTRAIARIYNLDWFPQVMIEKHQMGSTGTRYFVPPMHDPIAVNVDAGIWNWTKIFGTNMMKDMTREGLAGISQQYLFDDYWPGSTETCLWKGVIGMLTEAASAKVATPVYIEPSELSVSGKGLGEYKKSINMPLPWEGGWWRLSDIVDYEISSTNSLLKTASLHREAILRFRNDLSVREVERGKTTTPYYYVMPTGQRDASELVHLVNLLREHGVKVYQTDRELRLDQKVLEKGSFVVPLAQPFRAFIKEVLEVQEFPARHYTPGGEMIRPYDITSWSLPLHMGVTGWEVDNPYPELEAALQEIVDTFDLRTGSVQESLAFFPVGTNESFKAAFRALELGLQVERMTEEAEVGNQKMARGSFVITADQKGDAWEALLGELTVEPLYTSQKPASTRILTMPRIALVETNFHDMDAGWTRYVLDTYHVPFSVVKPGDFSKTAFAEDYDIVIFPSARKSILMSGKYGSEDDYYVTSYPPEYTKGIGKEGMNKLMEFVDKGGLIISWGGSTKLFEGTLSISRESDKGKGKDKDSEAEDAKEEFQLPFSDVSSQMSKAGFYCPGSLVKVNLKKDHPPTLGMPGSIGAFYRGQPAFRTSVPNFDMDRRVIGITPEKDIRISGYVAKEELLGNKSLMIWMKKGKGQFVLFGFNPNFRASTHATYKLLFNSILLPELNP